MHGRLCLDVHFPLQRDFDIILYEYYISKLFGKEGSYSLNTMFLIVYFRQYAIE
jgi:hypothetical protein